MEKWLGDHDVEGPLFDYKHFYGSYDYNADSRSWYRKEIRIIRNEKGIRSYKNAQGLRKNSSKLKVISRFKDTHPAIMQGRIAEKSWEISLDENIKCFNPVYKIRCWI